MKSRQILYLLVFVLLFSCSSEVRERMLIRNIDNLFQDGKVEQAKTSIDSFINHHPQNEQAWLLKGDIEEKLNNDSNAKQAYSEVLYINPASEQALTGMGIILRKMNDFDGASDYYNKAIQCNPDYAEAYSSLVMIELKRRNFIEAVNLGEKAYELENSNPKIAANLSIAYHYKGDVENRDRFYSIAKSLNYKNLKVLRMIYNGKATLLE